MKRCRTGKRRYTTAVEAVQALQTCEENGRDEKACYQCKHCEGYHLTSQDPASIGLAWSPEKGVYRKERQKAAIR